MKKTLIPLIFGLILSPAAYAQLACSSVFADSNVTAIDPAYLKTIATWESNYQTNLALKLTGSKAPVLGEAQEVSLSEFHKAREFRTWFERGNRMAPSLKESPAQVNAEVKLLSDPREALAAKIMAIRDAKYTIDIAYYIVRSDDTGMAILGELKDALRRGVNVRFVVDSLGTVGMTPHTPLRALIDYAAKNAGYIRDLKGNVTDKKAKVEIVEFNPLTSIFTADFRNFVRGIENFVRSWMGLPRLEPFANSINRRSHDKILLIDGAFESKAIAFIGGRNISNDYYGIPKIDENTYIDTEVMMKGLPRGETSDSAALGTQVQDYFDLIYFHLGNKRMTRSILGLVRGYDKQLMSMDENAARVSENLKLNEEEAAVRKDLLEDGFSESQVEIVNTFHNIFREQASQRITVRDRRLAVQNSKALVTALEKHLAAENQEIVLVSPYLWMSQRQVRMIKKWLLTDPKRKFTVITNSIMTSDNLLAQIMVDGVMGPEFMLDRGIFRPKDGKQVRRSISDQVKIYEFGKLDSTDLGGTEAYGKLHMKAVLLKGSKTSFVGTYNNDPRSLLLNSEGAAIVRGEKISADLQKTVDNLISRSHEWGSTEFHDIRKHEKLPGIKRYVAAKMTTFYTLIMRLNLWWLI